MSDSNGLVGSQLDAGSHVSAEASAKKDCDHANSDCSETNECSPDSPCYPLPFECDMTDDAAIAELLTMDMLDEDCSAQGAMQASVAAGNGAEPVQLVDAPDVVASADHTVMFRLPVVIGGAGGAGACPRPHGSDRGRDAWDAEHVRMPCSPHSLYPLSSGGGGGGGRGGGSDRDYIEHDRAGDNPTTVTGRGGDGGIIRGGNSGGGYVSTGRGGGGGGNEVEPGGGGPRLVSRWRLICQSLRQPFTASGDLERAVFAYNSRMRGRWNFDGWRHFVDEYLDEDESRHLLHRTLPALARLALCLPQLVCKPLPLLRRHCNRSVSLSQQQVACLLANAFFCTYPRRNAGFVTRRRLAASTTAAAAAVYPNINMSGLFAGGSGLGRRCEKLRCLLHYFHQVLKQMPCGTVTYTRHWVPAATAPDWARLPRCPLTRLRPSDTGVLEQQPAGQLHVDFANCLVGGGVLANGCVQEEIAFVQRPELVVACLLSERLAPGEALLVTGAQLFNATEGYRDTLQWRAPVRDSQPRDRYGRRMWRMVAIDAADYSHCSLTQWSLRSQTSSLSSTAAESSSRRHVQYRPDQIDRELLKAYAGFSVRANWLRHPRSQSAAVGLLPPVATGNWGCGAFGGDRRLKAVIQWLAASAAGRDTVYLTFGDRALCDQLVRLDRVAAAAATAATAAAASLCAGVDTAAAGGAAAATAGGGVVGVAFVYSLLLKYGAQMCSSSDRAGGAADCDVLEYMIAQMAAQTHSGNAAHGKPAHVASSVGESTASRQSSAATGVCSDSDSSPPVDSREQGTNGVTMTFDCEENVNTGSSCRGAKATSPVMTESSGNDTCTHGLSTMSIDGAVVSAANSTHNSGSPPTCRSTAEQKTTSIAKSANHSSNTERLHISESDDSDSQMSERLSLPKRMKICGTQSGENQLASRAMGGVPSESLFSRCYLWLLAARLLLSVCQTSYIHPDELLQSLEPVAGRVLGLNVTLSWEFTSRLPVRSWVALLLSAGPPVLLTPLPPRHLVAATRIWMFVVSLVVDWAVARSARLVGADVHQCLIVLSTSAALLVFASRPLSNALELALFALLLWRALAGASATYRASEQLRLRRRVLAARGDYTTHRLRVLEARERLVTAAVSETTRIGVLWAVGVFVRPTFAVFAAWPTVYWLFSGACDQGGGSISTSTARTATPTRGSSGGGDEEGMVRARLVRVLPVAVAVSVVIVLADSLLYGWLSWHELSSLSLSWRHIVLTPFNFVVYNVQAVNLAVHGVHWRGLHALLHMPLLFASLAPLLALELPVLVAAAWRSLVTVEHAHTHTPPHLLQQRRHQYCTNPIGAAAAAGSAAAAGGGGVISSTSDGGGGVRGGGQVKVGRSVLVACVVAPLAVLSLCRHQEPRFLLPLLVPLVLLYADRLQLLTPPPPPTTTTAAAAAAGGQQQDVAKRRDRERRWQQARAALVALWWLVNSLVLLTLGFAHQGGMWGTLASLRQFAPATATANTVPATANWSVVFSHTYPPPQSVLALPRHSAPHLHDLAGRPLPAVVQLLTELQPPPPPAATAASLPTEHRWSAPPPLLLLVVPTSLEARVTELAAARRVRLRVLRRHWPHWNSEAPPALQAAAAACSSGGGGQPRRRQPLGVTAGLLCVARQLLDKQLSLSVIQVA